jgi:hypothetical protein
LLDVLAIPAALARVVVVVDGNQRGRLRHPEHASTSGRPSEARPFQRRARAGEALWYYMHSRRFERPGRRHTRDDRGPCGAREQFADSRRLERFTERCGIWWMIESVLPRHAVAL